MMTHVHELPLYHPVVYPTTEAVAPSALYPSIRGLTDTGGCPGSTSE